MEAKAPDFPEKVYIPRDPEYPQSPNIWWERESSESNIEYTRTDAFVKKACEWIREFNNHHYIMRYSDSCEPPLSEVTEWFKNYMKGE